MLRRHHARLRQVQIVKPLPDGQPATAVLPPKSVNRRRHYADRQREQAQRRRQDWLATIRERHAKGVPLADISRALHLNYKTVRTYANTAKCPHVKACPPRSKRLTPYEPYLWARWQEGCRNGTQLFRELQAHGFTGSRTLISRFVAQLRRDEGLSSPWLPKLARREALTPRPAAAIILRRPTDRAEHEQTALTELHALHAELEHTVQLSERFTALVREQQHERFDAWLAEAQASSLAEARQFARNLRNDEAAVRAALEQPWSQGQVEGQVNRLKYVKRSMYGRAKFDLLRQRVLGSAEA